MAEGPTGPSIDSGYLYRQTMQAQGQGGSGSAPIFFGARLDTNVGSPFAMQQAALIPFDKMIKPAKQAANGPVAGLLKQMGLGGASIVEDLKKVAQNAGVMYSGDLPSGSLPGTGGGGGSFAAMVSAGRGDGGPDLA
jgi:hypothetical protein